MSTALIFSLIAIVCALVAVAAATRRRGPSVTTIETRTTDDDKTGE